MTRQENDRKKRKPRTSGRHISLLVIAASAGGACQVRPPDADARPNILLIVADDLGYSDLGSFGGDVETPNIDRLAARGLRFTQFHTAPLCAPTRAMLLTGNNNHVAGMGLQGGADGTRFEGLPGFESHLSDRVAPMPQLLGDAGYHTYIAGKWHLGIEPENNSARKGFERSFTLLQGGGNHYNDMGLESTSPVSLYTQDGEPVEYPSGEYSTEVYTDKLMEFIEGGDDGRPFFAFAAYTSPHWPLQVPEEFQEKYRGRYDMGYDRLREVRFQSLKATGIIGSDTHLPPRLESIRPWEDLSPAEKREEARKMELYAAMVDNLDHHVGRLVEFLVNRGLYDNTLIVFMSDNGAAPNDFFHDPDWKEFLQRHYDNSFENMGTPTSFVSYGPQWAQAGAAPFNRFKGYTTEGGMAAPLILAGVGIPAVGEIRYEYVTVMDLAPTFLEIAGAQYPDEVDSHSVRPMMGESMLPYLMGESAAVHADDYVTGLEHNGRAFLRKGNWKIVHLVAPFDEDNFVLYDLERDPGETTDLSERFPEKYRELRGDWAAFKERAGIPVP